MITYTYKCSDCEQYFEENFEGILGVSKPYPEDIECPYCGSLNTYRVIKNISFILKGNGWASKQENANNE